MTQSHLICNRYEIKEQIGAGGMGTVFRAIDQQSGKNVALKLLKSEAVAHDSSILTRFEREAEALRELNHPNIVKVFETVQDGDSHYIVMEYVAGGALNSVIKNEGKLPVEQVLKLAIELADALTRAHYLKIIHRDIKPANVLIADDNTPRLTDFGVAYMGKKERITQIDVSVGTPDYMSPESLKGESADSRSDIWSFGVMLFELLTHRHPFSGDSIGQLITAILSEPTPDLEDLRPDAPVELVDLIYRMLEKDPNARIPSIRLVGAELEIIMQGGLASTSSIYPARIRESNDRFVTPTPTPNKIKHNLPAQTTPFVGREDELAQIEHLMNNPNIRLLTIIGPGGMGKTRLSLAAAEDQLLNYSDGIFFVPLAPLSAPEDIASAIADAVGYSFLQDQRSPEYQLGDFLSDKEVLLVMDNFEHVISGANIVSDILRAAAQVNVLVTSRERLNLSGETLFHLNGMDFPEWETPEDALDYSAVKLFLQSAQRANPAFELQAKDLKFVARICRMVEGMPLGILLSAAWVEMLSLAEITEEMAQSLDFLETDTRDIPDRHRSLRAVFDYSWNLLTPDERDAFTKLSIFRGGFERDAAQKVAGASLRSLTNLVNKSLLIRNPDGRYYVHKLLQQYADEQFVGCAESEDDVHMKHADYYSKFLNKVEANFDTKRESATIDAIEVEFDNIRVAWRWALDNKQWEEIDRVLHTMLLFFLGRSMLTEGIATFDTLIKALEADNQSETVLYWRAKSRLAWLSGRLGHYNLVHDLSSAAYSYFSETNNTREIIWSLNNLSYACMFTGDYQGAIEVANEAAELSEKARQPNLLYTSLANRGYAEFLSGDYEKARDTYEILFQSQHTNPDFSPMNAAFGLNNLGEINQALGKFKEAKALFHEANDIFKSYKHKRGMAFSLNNLAGIHFVIGDHETASDLYKEAYRLYKDIGDRSGIGHSLSALGNSAVVIGDFDLAKDYYQQSLQIRRELGDRRTIADSLGDLATLAFSAGDIALASKLADESYALRTAIGDKQGTAMALMMRGLSQWFLGNLDEGERLLRESFAEAESLQSEMMISMGLAILGEIEFQKGNLDDAYDYYLRAIDLPENFQVERSYQFGLAGIAGILRERGEKERALEIVSTVVKSAHNFIRYVTEKAEKLKKQLRDELDATTAREAIQRGENKTLREHAETFLTASTS
ncbi:MAG: protein kinase [Aggregatilineales bacterium]